MPSNQDMVDLLEDALKKNIGVRSMTTDGTTVQFESTAEKMAALNHYKRLTAAEKKPRSMFREIRFQ